MSILGTANYIIEHRSDGSVAAPIVYVDNFENLRRCIALSWHTTPHKVRVKGMTVQVIELAGSAAEAVLASFEFKHIPNAKLPERL